MITMNAQVSNYISKATPEQRVILEAVRQLVQDSVPGVSEEFKWGRPVFRSTKDFAYLKTARAYVTLGFFNFEKLDDPQNKLEGTGKTMRHLKLKTMKDVDATLLRKWFKVSAR